MVIATLNVQKTGMITLPKKWRDRYPANIVIAEETPEGLLIKPYSDVEYWEDEKGNCGLHFPHGIPAADLVQKLQHASDMLDIRETRKKVRHSKKVK